MDLSIGFANKVAESAPNNGANPLFFGPRLWRNQIIAASWQSSRWRIIWNPPRMNNRIRQGSHHWSWRCRKDRMIFWYVTWCVKNWESSNQGSGRPWLLSQLLFGLKAEPGFDPLKFGSIAYEAKAGWCASLHPWGAGGSISGCWQAWIHISQTFLIVEVLNKQTCVMHDFHWFSMNLARLGLVVIRVWRILPWYSHTRTMHVKLHSNAQESCTHGRVCPETWLQNMTSV